MNKKNKDFKKPKDLKKNDEKDSTLCNFMAFLNDKCGHGVGAEYMVDPQNN